MVARVSARARPHAQREEAISRLQSVYVDQEQWRKRLSEIRQELDDLRSDNRGLTMENTRLSNENRELRARVDELIRVAETISARREAETRLHNDTLKANQRNRKATP